MQLRKIDRTNIWKIVKLSVEKEQEDFVATNTESILEAYAESNSGGVAEHRRRAELDIYSFRVV